MAILKNCRNIRHFVAMLSNGMLFVENEGENK